MSEETAQTPASEAAEKPRRGRPPKDKAAGPTETGTGKPKVKRAGKRKEKTSPEELSALANNLYGIHAMLSQAMGMPEMMLDAQSATILATGISRMQDEFDVSVSGKTGAVIAFVGSMALVYVPRVMAIKDRVEKAQAKKRSEQHVEAEYSVVTTTDNEQPVNAG